MTRSKLVWLAAVAVGLAFGTAASGARIDARPTGWIQKARQQLAALDVRRARPMTGYSRVKFGPAWEDVDDNGCDTRNDVLARDLEKVVFADAKRCVVKTGTLHDPYTGRTIHYVRGVRTSSAVQIDHLVALAAAWRTGAAAWAIERRLVYANDPLVLLAVDGPANEAKGDEDASTWLPPRRSYDCRYVAKQIEVKTVYRLWVTRAERDAVRDVLRRC